MRLRIATTVQQKPLTMFYTYILRSIEHPEQRYIGHTADLRERLKKHNKLRGFFLPSFFAQNCTFNFQNAPKCPVFDTRLRNFTERILTPTLCKILLPHASICTIKRKLRNFTEFCHNSLHGATTAYNNTNRAIRLSSLRNFTEFYSVSL